MATKKATKQQREAAEKTALKQRLRDMLRGAFGGYTGFIGGDDEPISGLGADCFARFVGAVWETFLTEEDDYRRNSYQLENFDTLDKLAEWLHSTGVRA